MTTKTTRTCSNRNTLLLFLILMLTFPLGVQAQVTIGGDTPPQNFSILELISNKKGGLRLPQLTTAQRDALSATTEFKAEKNRGDAASSTNPGLGLGLTIYNTDTNCLEYWDGYKWISLCLGTADIELLSPCGNYDPQNPPVETANGNPSGCEYTPIDKPACTVPSGKAYDVYLTAGGSYATIDVDPLTSGFTLSFTPNNSSFPRNAVVRVVNNCTGEFKDFIFSQAGAICPSASDPTLNSNSLSLCGGGSVFAHVTNAVANVDYIWTFAGVIVHTGNWYEIKRAGVYKVYTGLLGCGSAATLTVADNGGSPAPSPISISATNGGILCAGGNVILTANTTQTVLWYHDGIPLTGANKNNNPLTLSGAAMAGDWFAAVVDGACVSNSSKVLTLTDNTSIGTALPAPVATVNGQSQTGGGIVICKDGTLKLEVTNSGAYPAGTQYEWFNNGLSIGKGTDPIVYLVAPNASNMILSVTASDQSSSCPNTAVSQNTTVSFTSPNATSINNGKLEAAICGATPATLIADYAGAVAYEWMLNGATVGGQTNQTFPTTQTGNYTVRYRDGNGCWSKVSTTIKVVQSAPINMKWNPVPTDVIKGDTHTYSIIANPAAAQYQWSWTSTDPTAIVSITPIGDGSSAVVKYGNPTALSTNVTLEVKSKNHPCGDASLKQTIAVKDGCTTATSVNLTPNGSITMSEGATQNFSASSNASNNNADLRYQWFVGGVSQGAASATNTFAYTPATTGNYTVSVQVTNDCTTTTDNVTAQANITVKPDATKYTPDASGNFKLTGKDCFDVAQSNFGATCGTQAQRPGDFLDSNRNWVEGKQWIYTFTANAAYTNLQFISNDPSVLIKTETSNIAGKTHTLIFDQSVLTKAYGKDKTNGLTITVYALYEVGGVKKRVEQKIKVQDCWCGCGAYIARDVWKVFMCYNLGVKDGETADPLAPSQAIHGARYKFGAKNPSLTMADDQASAAAVPNWSNTSLYPSQTSGDWTTANNPCPAGFRVPTNAEWAGVVNTTWNPQTSIPAGTWTDSPTNYSTGRKFGDNLFLPAAGYRINTNGQLYYRGLNGYYWSSTQNSTSGYYMFLNGSGTKANYSDRALGFSVRCIAE